MYICRKCRSSKMIIETKKTQTGLYCLHCGAWQKWLSKDEIRAAHYKKTPVYDGSVNKVDSNKDLNTKNLKSLFDDDNVSPFDNQPVPHKNKKLKKDTITIEISRESAKELLNLMKLIESELRS